VKKSTTYRIVAGILIVVGAVYVQGAYGPIMPGADLVKGQAMREIKEYGRRLTVIDYTVWAMPGFAAMFAGWGLIRKARQIDRPKS
jgi:hypothetical protein